MAAGGIRPIGWTWCLFMIIIMTIIIQCERVHKEKRGHAFTVMSPESWMCMIVYKKNGNSLKMFSETLEMFLKAFQPVLL